jgi:D-sedoheptulose 7-phosphate isomerase
MTGRALGPVHDHLAASRAALAALEPAVGTLASWAELAHHVLVDGGQLLAAGNGGSAAHAQHLTSELVGRFGRDRRAFRAVCLSADTSALTAIGNDYGFEHVFRRVVEALGRPGDLLVLLSTSGRSPNLLAAAAHAREAGLTVLSFTGPGPNPLADASDGAVTVEAATTAAVQDAHQAAIHAFCAAFDHLHFNHEGALCDLSSS